MMKTETIETAAAAMTIECPHCSKKIAGTKDMHGLIGECPECNEEFVVKMQMFSKTFKFMIATIAIVVMFMPTVFKTLETLETPIALTLNNFVVDYSPIELQNAILSRSILFKYIEIPCIITDVYKGSPCQVRVEFPNTVMVADYFINNKVASSLSKNDSMVIGGFITNVNTDSIHSDLIFTIVSPSVFKNYHHSLRRSESDHKNMHCGFLGGLFEFFSPSCHEDELVSMIKFMPTFNRIQF